MPWQSGSAVTRLVAPLLTLPVSTRRIVTLPQLSVSGGATTAPPLRSDGKQWPR